MFTVPIPSHLQEVFPDPITTHFSRQQYTPIPMFPVSLFPFPPIPIPKDNVW